MSLKLSELNESLRACIEAQLAAEDAGRAARHLPPDPAGAVAVVECHSWNAPLAAQEVEGPTGARFRVCIGSRRKRLIDQDNLCEKYLVDLLRYGGVIPDDAPDQCTIEVRQTKCRKGEPEEITVEVTEL